MEKEEILDKIKSILSGESVRILYDKEYPLDGKKIYKIENPIYSITNENTDHSNYYFFELENIDDGLDVIYQMTYKEYDSDFFKVNLEEPLFLSLFDRQFLPKE